MDRLDRKLLDLLQSHLPLTERPYQALGDSLGVSEDEVLKRLQRLKEEKILRQIGAIFDSAKVGYQSTLVALEIEPEKLDQAALRLNRHPGISHNYARNHRYNLWFTLTLRGGEDLKAETARLAAEAKARDFLYLPPLAIFKIGVRLSLSGRDEEDPQKEAPVSYRREPSEQIRVLTPQEVRVIRVLQRDLPLQPRPFQGLAGQAKMEEGHLLESARDLLRDGIMRRFAGTLYHRGAGFLFNILALWPVPEGGIEEAGRRAATVGGVSHCYQRPTHPHWPYSLYTMFHGRSQEEAGRILASLNHAIGLQDSLILETKSEYKKERFQYFQEEGNGTEI